MIARYVAFSIGSFVLGLLLAARFLAAQPFGEPKVPPPTAIGSLPSPS